MPSFETGVRLLKNILIKKRSYSAFFADETDALHKAFPASGDGSCRGRSVFRCSGTQLETS